MKYGNYIKGFRTLVRPAKSTLHNVRAFKGSLLLPPQEKALHSTPTASLHTPTTPPPLNPHNSSPNLTSITKKHFLFEVFVEILRVLLLNTVVRRVMCTHMNRSALTRKYSLLFQIHILNSRKSYA